MKLAVFALIVWANGQADAFEIGSQQECEVLTAKLAPYVESANCESYPDYSVSAGYLSAPIMPSPADRD